METVVIADVEQDKAIEPKRTVRPPKLYALVQIGVTVTLPESCERMSDGFYLIEAENQKDMKAKLSSPEIIFCAMIKGKRLKIKEERKIQFM